MPLGQFSELLNGCFLKNNYHQLDLFHRGLLIMPFKAINEKNLADHLQ